MLLETKLCCFRFTFVMALVRVAAFTCYPESATVLCSLIVTIVAVVVLMGRIVGVTLFLTLFSTLVCIPPVRISCLAEPTLD